MAIEKILFLDISDAVSAWSAHEFRQLHYFVAVVEAGSVSAASRQVHVAQPALTRQIKLLERELKTPLFDRHARGQQLHPMPGIRFVRLEELDDCNMPLWVAWKQGSNPPALRNFIDMLALEATC